MQLTRGSEYAIRAVLDLTVRKNETKVQLKEIAGRMDIPEDFLAKIFQILNRAGIIKSFRGTKGGYALAKLPEEISLEDVIVAIDGPIKLNKCLNVECIDNTPAEECRYMISCPVHDVWVEVQQSLIAILRKSNFKALSENYFHKSEALCLKNAAAARA